MGPRYLVSILPAAMLLGTGTVSGQDFPSAPIRIVTSSVGGGNDFTSRLIAQGFGSSFGQQGVVENRGSIQAVEMVARAPSDGHTLLLSGGTLWVAPLLEKVSYDPVRDFAPITLAVSSPLVLVAHPSLPVKSVKELIALAKARKGELNYGSAATGGDTHLAMELLKSMAGIDMLRIDYKSATPGVNALLGGEVQLMFSPSAAVVPLIRSGKLRALAVANPKPSTLLPTIPTVASGGLPGYESMQMSGVFAPAKVAEARLVLLHREIVRTLTRADVKEKLANFGVEVVASTPQELATAIKTDMTLKAKVIKDANIRVQ